MKKRANISRKEKTLKWMHKTPNKTKRKKSTHINTRKKSTPHIKKSACNYFQSMGIVVLSNRRVAETP